MKTAFLDRDGTLIVEPPGGVIDSLEALDLIPGVIQGLLLLIGAGYDLVMVTNQDHLGSEGYPLATFELVQNRLLRILGGEGIRFSHLFICPHGPRECCGCRKPERGLIDAYLREHAPDLQRSVVIGDRESDVQLGQRIGCRTARLTREPTAADIALPDFLEICRRIVRLERSATAARRTNETEISVSVALDGSGDAAISTGIGFFDHMLEQLSRHSGIDMSVSARGDLHVDEHHTVEDTGIVLGQALRAALGEKRGIERYGFLLPMDDALAQVAIDLGGRPYLSLDAAFRRERVGDLPTELVEEFLRALANGLRANIHVSARGRNDHHTIESIFKALARSLGCAVRQREGNMALLPTTKGTL